MKEQTTDEAGEQVDGSCEAPSWLDSLPPEVKAAPSLILD
jgi:hypothetical protein